jgi:sodium/potassium-transporting ATPase subunit alpha
LSFADIQLRLGTVFDDKKPQASAGIPSTLAETRLAEFGPNLLSPAKKSHPFIKYLESLMQTFNLMLIFCAVFTWVLLGIDPVNNAANVYLPFFFYIKRATLVPFCWELQ